MSCPPDGIRKKFRSRGAELIRAGPIRGCRLRGLPTAPASFAWARGGDIERISGTQQSRTPAGLKIPTRNQEAPREHRVLLLEGAPGDEGAVPASSREELTACAAHTGSGARRAAVAVGSHLISRTVSCRTSGRKPSWSGVGRRRAVVFLAYGVVCLLKISASRHRATIPFDQTPELLWLFAEDIVA